MTWILLDLLTTSLLILAIVAGAYFGNPVCQLILSPILRLFR